MNAILQFLSNANAIGFYGHYKAAILSEEEVLLQQQPLAIPIQQVTTAMSRILYHVCCSKKSMYLKALE